MNDKITQQEVNSAAWAARDTFRGVVDPAQYKDYILVMLFLKYISDLWQEHYDTYRKQYGDDDERIRRKLDRERFTGDFNSLYERRNAANIGELINIVLDGIEDANKAKLDRVFRNIDFNSEANLGQTKDRNRRLKSAGRFRQARSAGFSRFRGRHRQCLYLPDRALCLRCRQKGRRVLHAQAGLAPARPTGQAQTRPTHLRPSLRFGRSADRGSGARGKNRQPRTTQQLRPFRPGGERQHLGIGAHEHVPAWQGFGSNRMGRHPQQPGAGRSRPPDAIRRWSLPIRPSASINEVSSMPSRIVSIVSGAACRPNPRVTTPSSRTWSKPHWVGRSCRGGRAAWRAVPWRRRRPHPAEDDRG